MCDKCADTGILGWQDGTRRWSDGVVTTYRDPLLCVCGPARKIWKEPRTVILYEYTDKPDTCGEK